MRRTSPSLAKLHMSFFFGVVCGPLSLKMSFSGEWGYMGSLELQYPEKLEEEKKEANVKILFDN